MITVTRTVPGPRHAGNLSRKPRLPSLSPCTGSRLPGLTRQGGKRTLQRPKTVVTGIGPGEGGGLLERTPASVCAVCVLSAGRLLVHGEDGRRPRTFSLQPRQART